MVFSVTERVVSFPVQRPLVDFLDQLRRDWRMRRGNVVIGRLGIGRIECEVRWHGPHLGEQSTDGLVDKGQEVRIGLIKQHDESGVRM